MSYVEKELTKPKQSISFFSLRIQHKLLSFDSFNNTVFCTFFQYSFPHKSYHQTKHSHQKCFGGHIYIFDDRCHKIKVDKKNLVKIDADNAVSIFTNMIEVVIRALVFETFAKKSSKKKRAGRGPFFQNIPPPPYNRHTHTHLLNGKFGY